MKTQEDVANPTTTSLAAYCFAGWSHIHDMWPPKGPRPKATHNFVPTSSYLPRYIVHIHELALIDLLGSARFPSQNAGVLHSKIMDLPSFFLGLFPPKMLGLSTEKSPLPGLRPRLDEFTGLRRQLAEDLVPVVISHDPPGEMPWCCRSTSWCCETRSCHGQKLTGAQ